MESKHIDHDRRRFVEGAAVPEQAAAATENNAVRPFHIKTSKEALVDLRKRISATKWPDRETVTDASQGVQLATTQTLARYWATQVRLAQDAKRS